MLGYVELLKEDLSQNPAALENANEIHVATRRASDLVRQILAFSRQQEQHPQVIHLDSVVKESVKFLRASLPAGIKIESKTEAHPMVALADPTQIYQVILNLATNAFHSMHGQNGCLTINLDSFMPEETFLQTHPDFKKVKYVRLTVADTGHGMDAATVQRIYEPFFTTKPVGQGTGLGLAVVHGILQAHHGKITVVSQVDIGTTFCVYLPAQENAVLPPDEASGKITIGSGQKILVVDDEVTLIVAYQRMLKRLNYQAVTCTHPHEAIKLFNSSPNAFDLVITDLAMPDMNGMEVMRQIRKIRPKLPVIIATGYKPATGESSRPENQPDGYVQKPFAILTLAEMLHKLLQRERVEITVA
jgi:CheY-like chemotaxis protein